MYDPNNIFAKILRGEIPCVKVFEDGKTLAFMDVMPEAEGHVLVVPKEPAENILDLSADGAAAMMATTQKIAKAVDRALSARRHPAETVQPRARRPEHLSRPFPHRAALGRFRLGAAWQSHGRCGDP